MPMTPVGPYLVPVMTDWLWLYPTSEYCARPDHRVRVPASRTIACVCDGPACHECDGYQNAPPDA